MQTHLNYKVLIFFIFFIFFVKANQAFPQEFIFRNFSSEDGLAQSYVYSIIQDVHGYLWLCTDNGLSRYDGFKFENFTASDSLADNFVSCGISDGECMWFGHGNGGISYFNGKKFHTVILQDSNSSPVTNLAKSLNGSIWVSTYSDGLWKLEKEKGATKHYMFKDQIIITSFDFINESELFIGTNNGLFYCRLNESGEIEKIGAVKEIPESKIKCIHKMRNNSGFNVGTENDGIFQVNYENNQFKCKKIDVGPDFNINGVQDIFEDSQSNLWLCSFGKGLIKLSGTASGEFKNISYINKANGFVTDDVKTVYEDREGNIWSGNYGKGVTLITPKTFSIWKCENPLYGNNIFSIYAGLKFIWIGTENGLLKTDPISGKVVKFYGKGSGLPKDTVTAIYSVDEKELWIGTEKNGLFMLEAANEKIVKFPFSSGTLENSITILTGKGDLVWIGTKKGLFCVNSVDKKINWFSINRGGLPHNYINCLYLDRTNRLWITTPSNTLAFIQVEKVSKIPINPGNGILTLGPITEDTDSRIWVGTMGSGVFIIEADSIIHLSMKEGLLSNYCYSLSSDDKNNVWVGHNLGLSRIRTTDFSMKPIKHFDNITGSCQFNPNAIFKGQNGKIWFGSNKGLICFDPSLEYQKLKSPVLGITSIKVNDEEREFADKIILNPGTYKIRISFIGISLREPELVTYQYKFEGYDQWSEITKDTIVTYKHLTEGDYKFILKASSGEGISSESPLTISIIILKPIWKKWWFYFINVSLLILATLIYFKRREYKLLAEKRILEEKVRERTYEIQCQKNEIVLQKDMIDEKNAHITSSIEYAKHIQNSVLPPVELIDKLFPENFILSKAKDIVSGDFYWFSEKDNKIIFTVADCTGHGVPGAFMSLLGITLLNEIVNIHGITTSDAIVTKLRDGVIDSFKQSRKDTPTSDGMDMSLCVLDNNNKTIQFTGAMNDLIYIHDGNLEKVKADRSSVCASYGNPPSFTKREFSYRKGDILYLFSDGYKDQFGGDFNKKFLSRYLNLTFLEIHKLSMAEQKEILEKKLNEWMKGNIQTDDITVLGIRL